MVVGATPRTPFSHRATPCPRLTVQRVGNHQFPSASQTEPAMQKPSWQMCGDPSKCTREPRRSDKSSRVQNRSATSQKNTSSANIYFIYLCTRELWNEWTEFTCAQGERNQHAFSLKRSLPQSLRNSLHPHSPLRNGSTRS